MKKEVHSYESGIRRIQEMLESQDTPGEIRDIGLLAPYVIGRELLPSGKQALQKTLKEWSEDRKS